MGTERNRLNPGTEIITERDRSNDRYINARCPEGVGKEVGRGGGGSGRIARRVVCGDDIIYSSPETSKNNFRKKRISVSCKRKKGRRCPGRGRSGFDDVKSEDRIPPLKKEPIDG